MTKPDHATPSDAREPIAAGYLRRRFEEGRKAVARGEYTEARPRALMARIRARVERRAR
jgi:hypothetical protein